jgi:hypothetical protein
MAADVVPVTAVLQAFCPARFCTELGVIKSRQSSCTTSVRICDDYDHVLPKVLPASPACFCCPLQASECCTPEKPDNRCNAHMTCTCTSWHVVASCHRLQLNTPHDTSTHWLLHLSADCMMHSHKMMHLHANKCACTMHTDQEIDSIAAALGQNNTHKKSGSTESTNLS